MHERTRVLMFGQLLQRLAPSLTSLAIDLEYLSATDPQETATDAALRNLLTVIRRSREPLDALEKALSHYLERKDQHG